MFELDVCETKDGQLVVHHDTNLKRTTGHDKLMQESIQSYGGGAVKTEKNRIPLLDTLFA